MSNTVGEAPRAAAAPRRFRWLVIAGVIALLAVGLGGIGFYWYEWKSARGGWRVQVHHEPYMKVGAVFLKDIEAGRPEAAYQSTTGSFRKRVGREGFEARARRYHAFKMRPGVTPAEASASGPVGGDDLRTNHMTNTVKWMDADGNLLQVSVTVVQEADSFSSRRPPPLRVGDFTVSELAPGVHARP